MKFGLAFFPLLMAACATTPGTAANERANSGRTAETRPQFGYDTGAEVGVTRAAPLLEKMPFGDSMFGRWRTSSRTTAQGNVRKDPETRLVHRDRYVPSHVELDVSDGSTGTHFVQKDFHTVMHYIALKTGAQIIAEGEVDRRLSVHLPPLNDETDGQELCNRIADALGMDCIIDGDVVILKERPVREPLLPSKPDYEGKYNVDFENHELINAIREVSGVTGVPVLVPESRGDMRVILVLNQVTAHEIFHALAEIGEMDVELVDVEGQEGKAYKFTYRNRSDE